MELVSSEKKSISRTPHIDQKHIITTRIGPDKLFQESLI